MHSISMYKKFQIINLKFLEVLIGWKDHGLWKTLARLMNKKNSLLEDALEKSHFDSISGNCIHLLHTVVADSL